MLSALHVGTDSILLKTRTAVLEMAGITVVSTVGLDHALASLGRMPFSAAIFCHSLGPEDRVALSSAFRRRHPQAPVLLVVGARDLFDSVPPGIDGLLDPHPHKMMLELCRILNIPVKSMLHLRGTTDFDRRRSGRP